MLVELGFVHVHVCFSRLKFVHDLWKDASVVDVK